MDEIKVGKISIPMIKGEKGEAGPKGDKGDAGANGIDGLNGADGYSPIKGLDYWTEEEQAEIIEESVNRTSEIVMQDVENELNNYYKKAETYNKTEIDNKISIIPKYQHIVVNKLPTTNISTEAVYLVPSSSDTNDMYREYIYINGKWELIGIQKTDLSNFYNKTEIDSKIENTEAKITGVENQIGDISSILDTINGEII